MIDAITGCLGLTQVHRRRTILSRSHMQHWRVFYSTSRAIHTRDLWIELNTSTFVQFCVIKEFFFVSFVFLRHVSKKKKSPVHRQRISHHQHRKVRRVIIKKTIESSSEKLNLVFIAPREALNVVNIIPMWERRDRVSRFRWNSNFLSQPQSRPNLLQLSESQTFEEEASLKWISEEPQVYH